MIIFAMEIYSKVYGIVDWKLALKFNSKTSLNFAVDILDPSLNIPKIISSGLHNIFSFQLNSVSLCYSLSILINFMLPNETTSQQIN